MASEGPTRSTAITATVRDVISPHGRRQLVRYAMAGALVGVVYVGTTLLLSGPGGLPIQAAIPIALVCAVSLHFVCQRWFVFRDAHAFELAMHHQVGRYILLGLMQYAIAAVSTGILPGVLGVPERVVYVGTVCVSSAVGFILLRTRIFHAPSE
jgi:putative flippase GtrA